MVRRWVAGLIAAVVLMSMGGVGFAAFTSSVYLNLNDTAGSLSIVWVGPPHPTFVPDHANDVCTDNLTATSFTLNTSNAAPGDGCTLPSADGVFIKNTGTITGSITVNTLLNTGPCGWIVSDNLVPYGTFPVTIAPGQSLPAAGLFIHNYMASGQGNECQGALGFTNTIYQIVATAGA